MLTTLAEVTFGAFVEKWRGSPDRMTIGEALMMEHPTIQQVLIGQMIDAMLELADSQPTEINHLNSSAVTFCQKMKSATTPADRAMYVPYS